jgi:serine protease inhibitor
VQQAEASIKMNEDKREQLRQQRQANVKSRLPLLRQAWTSCDDAMDVSEALITTGLQHAHVQGNFDAIARRVHIVQQAYVEIHDTVAEGEWAASMISGVLRLKMPSQSPNRRGEETT